MLGKLKKAYGISSGCHSKIQLTLEQHGFELRRSIYSGIFSVVNTTTLHDLQLVDENYGYRGPTINYKRIFNRVEGQYR